MKLPDLLEYKLDVVFCGTGAGNESARSKVYYADPRNAFYRTLFACGFTSKLINPHEFETLLGYKIGLTDLSKFKSGNDKDLIDEDYDTASFKNKMVNFKPRVICFNGKKAACIFLGLQKTTMVNYGLHNTKLGTSHIFIAPSTSAQARKHWDENTWRELRAMLTH